MPARARVTRRIHYTTCAPTSFVLGPAVSVCPHPVSSFHVTIPAMPTPSDVTLRRIARPDADPVQRLWSERFGGAASTQQNWIEAALNPAHSAVGLVAVDASTDAIVGLSFLDVGDRDYTHRYLSLDALDLDPPLADRNGVFHLSCVRSDWEGRGVGSAFYEHRLAVLRERSVLRAVGIAWHRPHTVDSRVLFENYGFTRLATVERYYDRFDERPHCPDCGSSCTCTASLYLRSIHAPRSG